MLNTIYLHLDDHEELQIELIEVTENVALKVVDRAGWTRGDVAVFMNSDQLDRLALEVQAMQHQLADLAKPYSTNDPDNPVDGI